MTGRVALDAHFVVLGGSLRAEKNRGWLRLKIGPAVLGLQIGFNGTGDPKFSSTPRREGKYCSHCTTHCQRRQAPPQFGQGTEWHAFASWSKGRGFIVQCFDGLVGFDQLAKAHVWSRPRVHCRPDACAFQRRLDGVKLDFQLRPSNTKTAVWKWWPTPTFPHRPAAPTYFSEIRNTDRGPYEGPVSDKGPICTINAPKRS